MDCRAFAFLVLSTFITVITPATCISPPLTLTPYIEQNNTQQARKLSKVNSALFLNVSSHSGFLAVDKEYNSNTFFWYFPVEGKPMNETPWILWLQGGPGVSSLAGLFNYMGPFKFDDSTAGLKIRESSWCKEYSMVFIDSPIGAGFSFTDDPAGFAHNVSQTTNHLYTALRQLVKIFPELTTAPLYLAGESSSGLYVPALAMEIMTKKSIDVDLQGLILGNPVLNRAEELNYTEEYYKWGLVDTQGALAAKELQDAYAQAIHKGDAVKAHELYLKLLDILQSMSGQMKAYNSLSVDTEQYDNIQDFVPYLLKEEVREALHVGDVEFMFNNMTAYNKLVPDFLVPASEMVEALLDHYRVLIYCGQMDLRAPCVAGAAARRSWRWGRHADFLSAPRTPWWANETVAGYVKSGGGLTEVLIRGAGHLTSLEKPAATKRLISFFIRGIDLPLPPNYQVLPEYTPPIVTPNKQKPIVPEVPTNTKKGSLFTESSGMIVSIVLNVIIVLIIGSGVIFYIKMKRKYEAFYYSTVDNLSDDIFLS